MESSNYYEELTFFQRYDENGKHERILTPFRHLY